MLVSAPLESAGVAMATYCGQNLGAKELGRIRRGVSAMTLVSFGYCAAAFVFNCFLGGTVASFFLGSGETVILADVRRYLLCNGAAYPMLAVIFVFRNALQGMGFSSQAMGAGLAELLARAIVAFALVGRYGFLAVCLANPAAWLFADALLLVLYRAELRRLDRLWSVQEQTGTHRESLIPVRMSRL